MRTGATAPRCSCTFGPVGTVGAAGAAPRAGGIAMQSNCPPVPTHVQPAPNTPFTASPPTACALPVALSPIHRSMPVSRVFVKAKRAPSAEKPIHVSCGESGTVTARVAPSAVDFSERPFAVRARCRPLVLGSMRRPARRSIGRASSAIVGMGARSSTAATSFEGLRKTSGGGGASRTSTIAFGGSR